MVFLFVWALLSSVSGRGMSSEEVQRDNIYVCVISAVIHIIEGWGGGITIEKRNKSKQQVRQEHRQVGIQTGWQECIQIGM